MAKGRVLIGAFYRAAVITTLIVMTLVAVLISLAVADWILFKTQNDLLSLILGIFVLFSYLAPMGAGIGVWFWMRGPRTKSELQDRQDTFTSLLSHMHNGENRKL
jgi:hypothetical protein